MKQFVEVEKIIKEAFTKDKVLMIKHVDSEIKVYNDNDIVAEDIHSQIRSIRMEIEVAEDGKYSEKTWGLIQDLEDSLKEDADNWEEWYGEDCNDEVEFNIRDHVEV